MQYVKLGDRGPAVSRLCFGGLVIGPLQANLGIDNGAEVILTAMELGVNFIDTAELYETYPYIREAVRRSGKELTVATKSYAYDAEGAKKSLEKARAELNCDRIGIFMLHEQESRLTLRGHREALEYYLNAREKGIIGAVGVSTHRIEVVNACADMPEIDVIHPIVNKTGLGIGDGSIDEMLAAVEYAHSKGKGIYSMKPLGGGNLIGDYHGSMSFVLEKKCIDAIAVGMQCKEEVLMNAALFNGEIISEEICNTVNSKKRELHIDYWCGGCGKCTERCGQKAISVVNGAARVDQSKCVLCGYCSSVCPQFAIKVV